MRIRTVSPQNIYRVQHSTPARLQGMLSIAPIPPASTSALRCVNCTALENGSSSGNGLTARQSSISGSQMMLETGRNADGVDLRSKGWNTLRVRDMMTTPALSLAPETTVMDAMAFLANHRISGVPVIDAAGRVLGVCSGYDLLALDSTPGKLDRSFFPPVDTCINEFGGDRRAMWSNFKQLRQKLDAANGSTVAEVMHRAFKIAPEATMEEAANVVVQKGAHRLCVVDTRNTLLGVVSRGDIMRATIANFQAYMDRQAQKAAGQAESASGGT